MSDGKTPNQPGQQTKDTSIVATGSRPTLGSVTIEIDTPSNAQLLFGPANMRLRGRWDSHRLPPGSQSEHGLMGMPTIPGMHVEVDPVRRVCRVYDPLNEPANRDLLARVSAAHRHTFSQDVRPVMESRQEDVDADILATWLYWCWRAVQSGNARVISGTLATGGEVKAAYPDGRITRDFFDSSIVSRPQPQTA